MVGGTFPMLLGPVIVLTARRLDEEGSDARGGDPEEVLLHTLKSLLAVTEAQARRAQADAARMRSEEHTSELQSRLHLVCRLLLEKKKEERKREKPRIQSCQRESREDTR